jgi:ribosomal protein S18 acetylase RimI-like enzyme
METGTEMTVQTRPAGPNDVEALLDMMRQLYSEDASTPFVRAGHRHAVEELLATPAAGEIWIFEGAGMPIGYLVVTYGFSLEFHGRDAFVDELFIAASHRRKGLGRRALAIAEEACRQRGVRSLHLEVEIANDAAHELYRRGGFRDHGRRLMTKSIGG